MKRHKVDTSIGILVLMVCGLVFGFFLARRRTEEAGIETRQDIARHCNGLYRAYHLVMGSNIPGHTPVPYNLEDVTMTNWEVLYAKASHGKGPDEEFPSLGVVVVPTNEDSEPNDSVPDDSFDVTANAADDAIFVITTSDDPIAKHEGIDIELSVNEPNMPTGEEDRCLLRWEDEPCHCDGDISTCMVIGVELRDPFHRLIRAEIQKVLGEQ